MATSGRQGVAQRIDATMRAFLRHWLLCTNLLNGMTLAGAVITPLVRAHGWTPLATLLYLAYRPLCPQRPDHSYFIAGYKMAFEQRETAIYLGLLGGGLLFGVVRGRLRSLRWRALVVASLPLLIDVLSQTVGLRGSDWRWRTATGIVFALAFVWWSYPLLERGLSVPELPVNERRSPESRAREIVLANPVVTQSEERR